MQEVERRERETREAQQSLKKEEKKTAILEREHQEMESDTNTWQRQCTEQQLLSAQLDAELREGEERYVTLLLMVIRDDIGSEQTAHKMAQ